MAAMRGEHDIVLIDLASMRVERVLTGHEGFVQRLHFSHDGRRLVSTGMDHTVRVWDVATGAERVLHLHDSRTVDAVFSPDDRLVVSTSEDRTGWVGPAGETTEGVALSSEPAALSASLGAWTTAALGADNIVRSP
jgi:WD40 repeat protein